MPAVVDLACMRDAMNKLGGDSNKINPLVNKMLLISEFKIDIWFFISFFIINSLGMSNKFKIGHLQVPVDLVIDHSVQVDVARSENAVQANMELEFQRNKERFGFLKWGSNAFNNMLVVPPGSGIVHQVIASFSNH